MTQEMKGLLLEDRWASVTSEMGFLELGAELAAPVPSPLEQVLSRLLPAGQCTPNSET